MSCEHHKTCGDCFSPQHVNRLESTLKELSTQYAEAAEWNLATLEELVSLKGSSKHRVERQKSISLKMLQNCVLIADRIDWGTKLNPQYSRVKRLLEEGRKEPHPWWLEKYLDAFIERSRRS